MVPRANIENSAKQAKFIGVFRSLANRYPQSYPHRRGKTARRYASLEASSDQRLEVVHSLSRLTAAATEPSKVTRPSKSWPLGILTRHV